MNFFAVASRVIVRSALPRSIPSMFSPVKAMNGVSRSVSTFTRVQMSTSTTSSTIITASKIGCVATMGACATLLLFPPTQLGLRENTHYSSNSSNKVEQPPVLKKSEATETQNHHEPDHQIPFIWRRFVALLIDVAGFAGLSIVASLVVPPTWVNFLINLCYAVYAASALVLNDGQTLGKKAMHVRVVSMDGSKVTVKQSILRLITSGLMTSIFGIDGLVMFFSPKRRCVHDWVAGTVVVTAH